MTSSEQSGGRKFRSRINLRHKRIKKHAQTNKTHNSKADCVRLVNFYRSITPLGNPFTSYMITFKHWGIHQLWKKRESARVGIRMKRMCFMLINSASFSGFCFSPVNLVDSYENRFAFACAFGATTTRCLTVLLLDNYYAIFHPKMYAWTIDPEIPSYTKSKYAFYLFFRGNECTDSTDQMQKPIASWSDVFFLHLADQFFSLVR